MPVGKYKIITVGNQVGIGATGAHYVTVNAFAKQNVPNAPYCIPNEMICGEIGRFLGLPLPPWGIVQASAPPAESWFATLDFNLTGNALPPIDPAACWAALPDHSTGVLLFDTLIANCDRHSGNLSLDTQVQPPRMNVFDHSHALFGFTAGQGMQRLVDLRDRLGMSGGPHTHGNRHCLLDAVTDDASFGKWFDRIRAIPDFLIEDICGFASDLGIDGAEANAAVGFLKFRRDRLREIVEAHRSDFRDPAMESLLMSHPRYLIAKYIPDLQRVEPRNVGIIVWTPEATEARFLAEKASQTGEVDGRSIPGFVTSTGAYRQWVSYWRGQVRHLDIVPATGGPKVSRRSPDFLPALMAANRGNFVLAEGGHVLDSVGPEELPDLADHLFRELVETTGPDEPRDPSLDELCGDLIRESRLAAHPLFKTQYPVTCPVSTGIDEEFEFTYGLGNGVPYHLIQRLPLPKRKGPRQKSINDVAWKFDRVIRARIIDGGSGHILIYPTDEQRADEDVQSGIRILESITNVLDLKETDRAKAALAGLSSSTLS